MRRKSAIWLSLFALLCYVVAVEGVYVFQRSLEYHPNPRPFGQPEQHGLQGMKTISTPTQDGLVIKGWFAPPAVKTDKIAILFHGNGGSIVYSSVRARAFMEQGYGVYVAEYRGYGGNPGTPTEQGLYMDGRAIVAWLKKQGYNAPRQFIFFGTSLGTGVAVEMAHEFPPAALILEAPFDTAAAVGEMRYPWIPVRLLMKDQYDSIDKIKDIHAPLLIVHGDADETVPIELGRILYAAANDPKKFIEIKGGQHYDLYAHGVARMETDWLRENLK